jgi:hypothetical protein
MRFVIYRTSTMLGSKQPCPHPAAQFAGELPPLRPEGAAHPYWTIEIESLEELIEFIEGLEERHQRIILSRWHVDSSFWAIEIYDDYRE